MQISKIYTQINRFLFLSCCYIRKFLFINPNISIGKNTIIESSVSFNTIYGGRIEIGKNCQIRKGAQLLTYGGNIIIGNECSINPYTVIYGQGNIVIGNYVRIAAHCVLIPSNHIYSNINIPIYKQGLINKGIIIEEDVWIGCNVQILDGVTIKRGCIIGANSVVTHSTLPYSVYVGNPARKIKNRGE
jgi:acetyltransferase-like isoleucine patch superfamily enzyme